ncbi:hypothetical protein [Actinotalea sp. K2]|uniref:hypothetical protein n=1 Tax=Actinotalea sp. K2 TaxID=2939438 RepID=UPI0020175761|nr:hypothetical protein [Actinotalea sp. K2]MCL3860647.1 hypothetical protein [Actinotalea sp. K2]
MESSRDRWWPSPTALSALCIVGLAVSASILMLLVPSLFLSGAQVHPLVVVGLVAVSAGFAVGARYWRPEAPRPDFS